MLSDEATVEYENLNYLKINRIKLDPTLKKSNKQSIVKYDPEKYFYLASYSPDTFMSNDLMRDMLFRVNSGQIDAHKKNIDIVDFIKNRFNNGGSKASQQALKNNNTKYFNFP
jgi:hypothetical protein